MKNKLTALTLSILLTVILTGCASLDKQAVIKHSMNTLIISEAIAGLDELLAASEERVLAASEVFTPEEWMKLAAIDMMLTDFNTKMNHLVSGEAKAKTILVSIAFIDTKVSEMYEAYRLARSVFHSSRDRLTREDVEFYIQADEKIEKAYLAYKELKSTKTGSDATALFTTVIDALKLVVRVVTVVAPLILI